MAKRQLEQRGGIQSEYNFPLEYRAPLIKPNIMEFDMDRTAILSKETHPGIPFDMELTFANRQLQISPIESPNNNEDRIRMFVIPTKELNAFYNSHNGLPPNKFYKNFLKSYDRSNGRKSERLVTKGEPQIYEDSDVTIIFKVVEPYEGDPRLNNPDLSRWVVNPQEGTVTEEVIEQVVIWSKKEKLNASALMENAPQGIRFTEPPFVDPHDLRDVDSHEKDEKARELLAIAKAQRQSVLHANTVVIQDIRTDSWESGALAAYQFEAYIRWNETHTGYQLCINRNPNEYDPYGDMSTGPNAIQVGNGIPIRFHKHNAISVPLTANTEFTIWQDVQLPPYKPESAHEELNFSQRQMLKVRTVIQEVNGQPLLFLEYLEGIEPGKIVSLSEYNYGKGTIRAFRHGEAQLKRSLAQKMREQAAADLALQHKKKRLQEEREEAMWEKKGPTRRFLFRK